MLSDPYFVSGIGVAGASEIPFPMVYLRFLMLYQRATERNRV